jgi:3-oxoacyl-[acyl-carrier protein] reductase
MSLDSNTRVAIVTGSTKGIGRSIAGELAARGIAVVITGRELANAQRVAGNIVANGGLALGLRFDLGNQEDVDTLIRNVIGAYGRLDILVNNALCRFSHSPFEVLDKEQMLFAFSSNIGNTALLTQSAYPYLKESRGNIINIGSVVTNKHLLGLPLYGIIKGAIVQMTKVLAAEWGRDGIRVNAINPGFIRTEAFADHGISDDLIEKSYDYYKGYQPLGIVGEPADIGKVAAYLASDEAGFITGAVIDIDGGFSIRGLPLYQDRANLDE